MAKDVKGVGELIGTLANAATDYLYDGARCVEERNASDQPIRQYVWGLYIDELVQLREIGGETAGDYYVLSDLLHRTAALTDVNRNIVETYDYDAYGRTRIYNSPGTDGVWFTNDDVTAIEPRCRFLFTGQEFDTETQLYYYDARTYDPVLGRFLQRDPIGYGDGMNLYQYTKCNPANRVDPTGKWNDDVHHDWTYTWATYVGYTPACAEQIASADKNVDNYLSNTAPFPIIGDMRYHFDTDALGIQYLPGTRQGLVDLHLQYAKQQLTRGTLIQALIEIGTALHPLQDMFSHNSGHKAAMPTDHAPKEYCIFTYWTPQDPYGLKASAWCRLQQQTNPNWNDPHLPDMVDAWPGDFFSAAIATQQLLGNLLNSESKLSCRCRSKNK